MNRFGTLLAVVIVMISVSVLPAQPLPCADAFRTALEEIIASLQALGLPAGPARSLEAVLRNAIDAADRGNVPAALGVLGAAENRIEMLVRTGQLDPVAGEALIALIEQARSVLSHCTATPPVVTFNCRSGDGTNDLMWLNPPGSHLATHILARTDTYPQGPTDPAALVVGVFAGGPGEVGRATHDTLANDVRYYYAAYAEDDSGELSPGRFTFGRPQDSPRFRWSYTAGGTGRPSVGGLTNHFVTSSSVGFVFALEPDADGGVWTAGYVPANVPSPTASRPITLPGSLTPNGAPWALVTSREGRVWAINATTGATEWVSPELGDTVEAPVCAMLRDLGGIDDVVMVGSVNASGGNSFYGLDFLDGSVSWSFDNGGGSDSIGPIRDSCTVDYVRRLVYFTSEPARKGSPDTVWALELAEGSAAKLWSEIHPAVNTSVVRAGEALYIGTNLGEVLSVDVADGSSRWTSPYATGDGPVVGFVFPGGGGRLAFSTTNRVHLIQDQGDEATPLWDPPVSLSNPNVPLLLGDAVIVADDEGRVFSLDASVVQPEVVPFATYGDPSRRSPPGLPFYNVVTKLYGVGTFESVLYVVERP